MKDERAIIGDEGLGIKAARGYPNAGSSGKRFVSSFLLHPSSLILGDVIALLLFVLVGQADHNTVNSANPLGGWLLLGSYFIVPWLVAGWRLGAFKGDYASCPYAVLTRALNTWLVAAPLGILLRALAIGEMMIPLPFILAAMTFGGLFVLVWRLLFFVLWRWARRGGFETRSPRAA